MPREILPSGVSDNLPPLEDQQIAVYRILKEHYPTLAVIFESQMPDTAAKAEVKTLREQHKMRVDETGVSIGAHQNTVEDHSRFSLKLIDVIQDLIEKQHDSHKRHLEDRGEQSEKYLRGTRELWERGEFNEKNALDQVMKQKDEQIQRLEQRRTPWKVAALIAWLITLGAIGFTIAHALGYIPVEISVRETPKDE